MRAGLLKQLLAVPSRSLQEGPMAAWLSAYVKEGGARRGRCWRDALNNVFTVKGQAEFYPCVAAHLDTVHPGGPARVEEQHGALFGYDQGGRRVGIGADDKAGVFVCLELLERLDTIAVALFAAEEIGGKGACGADGRFFAQVGYLLEFDAPGRGLVSYTVGGARLFQHDGCFIQRALPALNRQGAVKWQRHPFTDVTVLRQRFGFSCLNLSSGYHNWHRSDEYLKLSDTESAIHTGAELIRALGKRRYDYDARLSEPREPPGPVTDFRETTTIL